MERNKVYCFLRNKWVVALPEEVIRQQLMNLMVNQLGYPKGSLSIETDLREVPHLKASALALPERRADLIAYAKGIHPQWDLYPLLLVECKAVALSKKSMIQLVGYNHVLKAAFIALTNGKEMQFGWSENGKYRFIDQLPSYESLMGYADMIKRS